MGAESKPGPEPHASPLRTAVSASDDLRAAEARSPSMRDAGFAPDPLRKRVAGSAVRRPRRPSSAPTPVVIVGAGNIGKLLFDCIDGDPRWEVTGFIDDGLAGGQCFGRPIYAADDYDPAATRDAFMAIGFPAMRRQMLARVTALGLRWRTFVDRRSMVGRDVDLGTGVLVMSFAGVASGVRLGDFTFLSGYAHVGSGAAIGAFSSVMFNAIVGKCTVGDDCILGIKSACLDGAEICDGAEVSPYTMIRRRVPPGALAAGSPARVLNRDARREPV